LCREYLNLQKWIEDKIREHKEIFVAACVKFLQVNGKVADPLGCTM
jgi:hypothetical protein